MPKCPLCIAAWLGVFGLAGIATKVDPRLVWIAAAFVAGIAGAGIVFRLGPTVHGVTSTNTDTNTREGDGT
jgi:hypothetical protein